MKNDTKNEYSINDEVIKNRNQYFFVYFAHLVVFYYNTLIIIMNVSLISVIIYYRYCNLQSCIPYYYFLCTIHAYVPTTSMLLTLVYCNTCTLYILCTQKYKRHSDSKIMIKNSLSLSVIFYNILLNTYIFIIYTRT